MARRARVPGKHRPRAREGSVVVPFPGQGADGGLVLERLVPSGRSLLLAAAIALGAMLCILVARETSLFAVRTIDVTGAPRWVDRQVASTLAERRGESLVALDLADVARRVEALPTVASATFDRAYPHTLRVRVVAERPVAVVRQGRSSYVVSERGRVIAQAARGAKPALPRIWAGRDVELTVGETVDSRLLAAVRAVTPLAGVRLPARVTSVRSTAGSLRLRLATGLELRLGDPGDVDLKLAVAERVLPRLRPGSRYLDVSVPERPVAGITDYEPQPEVENKLSTTP